jgi:hypothetical protein
MKATVCWRQRISPGKYGSRGRRQRVGGPRAQPTVTNRCSIGAAACGDRLCAEKPVRSYAPGRRGSPTSRPNSVVSKASKGRRRGGTSCHPVQALCLRALVSTRQRVLGRCRQTDGVSPRSRERYHDRDVRSSPAGSSVEPGRPAATSNWLSSRSASFQRHQPTSIARQRRTAPPTSSPQVPLEAPWTRDGFWRPWRRIAPPLSGCTSVSAESPGHSLAERSR